MACGIGPPPELPPPPADATASCVYEMIPPLDVGVSTSTLWFNGLGQMIRIDGLSSGPYRNSALVPTYFTYDDQGRVIELRNESSDFRYDYTPQQITETSDRVTTQTWSLVDGRVVHSEYPTNLPVEKQSTQDYTYDSSGRIASYSSSFLLDVGQGPMRLMSVTQYTYDPQGRMVTLQYRENGELKASYSLTYAETTDRLVITADSGSSDLQRWTYDFDASHRVIRFGINYYVDRYFDSGSDPDDVVALYSYLDGAIVESSPGSDRTVRATGACPPPTVVVAHQLPLPLRWDVNYVSLSDVAAAIFGSIDVL